MLLLSLATPLVLLGTLLGMHAVERWLEADLADVAPTPPAAPERPAVVTLPRQRPIGEAVARDADQALTG